jgi:hypothetical protein
MDIRIISTFAGFFEKLYFPKSRGKGIAPQVMPNNCTFQANFAGFYPSKDPIPN